MFAVFQPAKYSRVPDDDMFRNESESNDSDVKSFLLLEKHQQPSQARPLISTLSRVAHAVSFVVCLGLLISTIVVSKTCHQSCVERFNAYCEFSAGGLKQEKELMFYQRLYSRPQTKNIKTSGSNTRFGTSHHTKVLLPQESIRPGTTLCSVSNEPQEWITRLTILCQTVRLAFPQTTFSASAIILHQCNIQNLLAVDTWPQQWEHMPFIACTTSGRTTTSISRPKSSPRKRRFLRCTRDTTNIVSTISDNISCASLTRPSCRSIGCLIIKIPPQTGIPFTSASIGTFYRTGSRTEQYRCLRTFIGNSLRTL